MLFYFVWFFFVILGFYLDCYRGFVKFFGVAKLARFDCFFFFVVVVWLTSQVGWVCGEYFYADLTGFDERFLRITEFLVVVVVVFPSFTLARWINVSIGRCDDWNWDFFSF